MLFPMRCHECGEIFSIMSLGRPTRRPTSQYLTVLAHGKLKQIIILKLIEGTTPCKGAKVLFNSNLHHRYFTWAGGQKERVGRTVAEPRPTGLDGGNGGAGWQPAIRNQMDAGRMALNINRAGAREIETNYYFKID